MVAGLVARFVPPVADRAAVAGAVLMVVVAGPLAVYAFVVRRSNQAAYTSAVDRALASGRRVRVVETAGGDHEYLLFTPPSLEPLDLSPGV